MMQQFFNLYFFLLLLLLLYAQGLTECICAIYVYTYKLQ